LENVQLIRGLHQGARWGHRTETSRRAAESAGFAEVARRNLALEDQLAELRREYDDLRRTVYEAAHVQRNLCGPRHVRHGSFELASEIFPVRHLSGDFISVFEFEDDVVFAIGDIEGKGLSAGMWFTHVVGMIRLQFAALGDPAATLSAMNRALLHMRLELPLTTLFLARLNPQTGDLSYSNAGHPPSLLLQRDGEVQNLREGGPVLGVVAGACFTNGKATLKPGDTLLGYSDGIAECRNPSGGDFGVERLLAAAQVAGSSAIGMLFSVLGAAEDFAGSQPREDDMALVVVHRARE